MRSLMPLIRARKRASVCRPWSSSGPPLPAITPVLQPLRSAPVADQLPLTGGSDVHTWSVAELGAALQRLVQGAYPAELWVQGELRNLRPSEREGKRNLF